VKVECEQRGMRQKGNKGRRQSGSRSRETGGVGGVNVELLAVHGDRNNASPRSRDRTGREDGQVTP